MLPADDDMRMRDGTVGWEPDFASSSLDKPSEFASPMASFVSEFCIEAKDLSARPSLLSCLLFENAVNCVLHSIELPLTVFDTSVPFEIGQSQT